MDRILYKEANGDLTCRSRDFEKVFPTLYAYEELELTPEEIEQQLKNFSSFLMEMTGGQMSKTNYTVEAMVTVANDYQQREIDELEQKLEQVKNERDALAAELKDERYRHDRVQDFEVAEAQELAKVKAELDAALADLNEVRPCTLCAYHHDPKMCRTCMGEKWKWRGAKDTNVPAKKEE